MEFSKFQETVADLATKSKKKRDEENQIREDSHKKAEDKFKNYILPYLRFIEESYCEKERGIMSLELVSVPHCPRDIAYVLKIKEIIGGTLMNEATLLIRYCYIRCKFLTSANDQRGNEVALDEFDIAPWAIQFLEQHFGVEAIKEPKRSPIISTNPFGPVR